MAKHRIDFTGVTDNVRCSEGMHRAKIIAMEEKTASTGNDMIEAQYQVIAGDCKGAIMYDNLVLTKKALFKLKNLLSALGQKAEGKNVVVDTDRLIGKTLTIQVSEYEYEGKPRCNIERYHPAAASASGKSKKEEIEDDDDFDDDVEEDDEDGVDYSSMTARQLLALCKERGIKAKVKQKAAYYIDLLETADEEAEDEDEEDDDDWDEEDE